MPNLVLACVPGNRAKSDRPAGAFAPGKVAALEARVKAPLRDAAAVQSTRWALWRAPSVRMPAHVASGGPTKWDRARVGLPTRHPIDALAVGELDTITRAVATVLVTVNTAHGPRQGVHHRRISVLQRAGGYGYTTTEENLMRVPSPGSSRLRRDAPDRAPIPPPEEPGSLGDSL